MSRVSKKQLYNLDSFYSFEEIIRVLENSIQKRTFCGILRSKHPKWVGFNYLENYNIVKNVSEEQLIELAANFWYFNQKEFKERFEI